MHYDQDTFLSLLRESRDAGATDIHLKVPGRPRLRIDGRLVPTQHEPLMPDSTFQIANLILQLAHREIPLATVTDEEIAFGVQKLGRFRAHLYKQRGSLGIIVHRMAFDIPSFGDLGADPMLAQKVWAAPGLTIVTGAQGRVALMAALIDGFNRTMPGHLVSLEHPMEFLHRDNVASIAQREIPVDTPTIIDGLRSALLNDCDAIVVSDVPDATCADLVLRMAESGRRVVAGLVGSPGKEAVRWFTHLFPQHREREIFERLARTLRYVVEYRSEGVRVLQPNASKKEAAHTASSRKAS